jgi:hypothetical protein
MVLSLATLVPRRIFASSSSRRQNTEMMDLLQRVWARGKRGEWGGGGISDEVSRNLSL